MAVRPELSRPEFNPVPPATTIAARGSRLAVPLLRGVPPYEPAPEQSPPVSAVVVAPARGRRPAAAPRPRPQPDPVSPAALVRAQQVFRLTFEVLEGRRGPQQLQQGMVPELVAMVTTLARTYVAQRARTTARLHRVHVQQVTPRAAEACVAVDRGARVHAVAARMELGKSGWRCTALRIG